MSIFLIFIYPFTSLRHIKCVLTYEPLSCVFLANYVPKCQMSSGPYGPIFGGIVLGVWQKSCLILWQIPCEALTNKHGGDGKIDKLQRTVIVVAERFFKESP